MRSGKTQKKYLPLVAHYEACLDKYGDTHRGVDWPDKDDADKRYKVMLEVIRDRKPGLVSLLDFGCGASHLYEYIRKHRLDGIQYSGLDLSEKFVALSSAKFPHNAYYCLDILDADVALPVFDYVIMNGVFTLKRSLSFEEMFCYLKGVLKKVFQFTKTGLAFNVMSKHVDWERDDLFHLPFDALADFLTTDLSRHFMVRHDYGLFEYTVYVYKETTA